MLPKGAFPLRENCDPENPDEAFLWMFAALPGLNGAPLMMPVDYYRKVSRRLWELGARPVEEPVLEYIPPGASDPHWATAPGRWVPAGSVVADPDREYKTGLARMGNQQKAALLKVLRADQSGATLGDSPAEKVVKNATPAQRAALLRLLEAEDNTA